MRDGPAVAAAREAAAVVAAAVAADGVAADDDDGTGGGVCSLSSACSSQAWASLVRTVLRSLPSYAVRTHRYTLFSPRVLPGRHDGVSELYTRDTRRLLEAGYRVYIYIYL